MPLSEWASAYRVSVRTAQNWAARGALPAVQLGSRWFIDVDRFREHVAAEVARRKVANAAKQQRRPDDSHLPPRITAHPSERTDDDDTYP